MPALKLAVALRIIRRGPHVGHLAQPDKFFEILSNKLGSVVRNDARMRTWYLLTGRLQHDLDPRGSHGFLQSPVHNKAAVAIQHAAQIIERTSDVEIGDIDVPVLRGAVGCSKPWPFEEALTSQAWSSPALFSTRYTVLGAPATRCSSIMRYPSRR